MPVLRRTLGEALTSTDHGREASRRANRSLHALGQCKAKKLPMCALPRACRRGLQRRSVELILDRDVASPRSLGAKARHSGAYVEPEQRRERGEDQARQNQFNRPPL
ncbi:MAG: hypothetical protein RL701_1216, partial [Pseudomonadota bacterium]